MVLDNIPIPIPTNRVPKTTKYHWFVNKCMAVEKSILASICSWNDSIKL